MTRQASSNVVPVSPLALPLALAVAPVTLLAVLIWPVLVLGSFIPIVGLFCLTSLLSVTAFLYLAIPTTAHLLFSQAQVAPSHSSSSFLPFTLPNLPLFSPNVLAPIHLTHSILRLLYDAYRASLVSLFFDSISKRILILGGSDSSSILKENIVYSSSRSSSHPLSNRLDVYYPETHYRRRREDSTDAPSAAPVILLLASPTYRVLGMRSFPGSQIALRLRRLGYCVVVPSLTSLPGRDGPGVDGDGTTAPGMETLVGEVRASLSWIRDEVERFGGDRENVWILGQGVGATVAMLAVTQSAVVVARDAELEKRKAKAERRRAHEAHVGRDTTDERDGDGPSRDEEAQASLDPFLADPGHGQGLSPRGTGDLFFARSELDYSRHLAKRSRPGHATDIGDSDSNTDVEDGDSISSGSTVPFPAGVNACRIFPRDRDKTRKPEDRGETITRSGGMVVRGMILVGGAYDNLKQMKRERELGLSHVSALENVLGPTKSDAEHASSSHLLYAASSLLSASPSSLPTKFLIVHGGADRLVPYSQSVLLKNLLVGVGIASERVQLRLYRHETGLGSLTSLVHQTKYSPFVLSEIERMISADQLDKLEEDDRKALRSKKELGVRGNR
ncbi:hypothetical protein JCM11491_004460 [Sporobolomyces phaffii]